jgi:hypothetical protein
VSPQYDPKILRKTYTLLTESLASFAFSFVVFLSLVFWPRVCIRRVDHDDDDEGEHDRRDCSPGQDQQGYYFG